MNKVPRGKIIIEKNSLKRLIFRWKLHYLAFSSITKWLEDNRKQATLGTLVTKNGGVQNLHTSKYNGMILGNQFALKHFKINIYIHGHLVTIFLTNLPILILEIFKRSCIKH